MSSQLSKRAHWVLTDAVDQVERMAHALQAISRVVDMAHLVQGRDACARCQPMLDEVTTSYVLNGLNEAISVLATGIGEEMERLAKVFEQEGVDITREVLA